MYGEQPQTKAEDRPVVLGYHAPKLTQTTSLPVRVLIWTLFHGIVVLLLSIFQLWPLLPVSGWLLAAPIELVVWWGWVGHGWTGILMIMGMLVGNSLIYGLAIALIIHWWRHRQTRRL